MTDKSDTFTPLDRPQRLTYTGPKHYDWVQANLDAMGLTVEQAAETFAQADRVIRIEGDALSVLRQVALSVTREGLSSQGTQARLTVRCTEESVALGDTEELRAFHRRPGLSAYDNAPLAERQVEAFKSERAKWERDRSADPFRLLIGFVRRIRREIDTIEGVPLRERNAVAIAAGDLLHALYRAQEAVALLPDLPDGYSYAPADGEE